MLVMGELVKSGVQSAGDRVLALIHTKHPGYHPLLAIAALAHDPEVKKDPKLELECHKTLVKYVTPELKSLEVKAEINETRRVIVSMFDGEVIDLGAARSVSFDAPVLLAEKPDPMWDLLEVREELAA